MVRHQNPSITERALRILNTKAFDQLSSEVTGPIATIAIQPTCKTVRSGVTGSSGTLTLFTTPSDKDFYLCSFTISLAKDSTCDTASGVISLSATIDGVSQRLASLAVLTLTAQSINQVVSLQYPLKVDRNTAISINGTFTVGAMQRVGTLLGYTEEN